jgi:membrane fusion protein, heavy metal efflux system
MKQSFTKSTFAAKRLILKLLLVSPFIFYACSNGQEQGETASVAPGLPPSLLPERTETIIRLSQNEVAELNIQTTAVLSASEYITLSAPGKISVAQGYAHAVSAPIQGKVQQIFFTEGQTVKAGDVIFQIESNEYSNLIAQYIQASATAEFEQSQMARIEQLVEKRIAPQNDLDKVKSELHRANAQVAAFSARLRTIGLTDGEIANLAAAGNKYPQLKIKAPISGKVDFMDLEPGQAVEAYDFMARIIDNTKLMVSAYISPSDAIYVKKGDSMKIPFPGKSIMSLSAEISTINPGLDELSRSAVAHAFFDNKDELFKPGETNRIEIETRTESEVISIPIEAITYDGDFPIVFVRVSENAFERKAIKIGEMRNGRATIKDGLLPGEMVAVSQIFSLKALMRFDLFSEE